MRTGFYANLGNTALQLGAYGDGWLADGRFEAAALRREGTWDRAVAHILDAAGVSPSSVQRCALCASTPDVLALCAALAEVTGVAPSVLGRDMTVPMQADYDPPGSLGQDRLLSGYAAAAMVGRPCIVLDAGTCLTCEAVSPEGVLLPVAIAPGLPALLSGVTQSAAHLSPALQRAVADWATPRSPARSSAESLLSGLHHCLVGTARELVAAARSALDGTSAPIVLTGGDAPTVLAALGAEVAHYPLLLLDGLRLLADEMRL
jgi:type III pantothenate kinase